MTKLGEPPDGAKRRMWHAEASAGLADSAPIAALSARIWQRASRRPTAAAAEQARRNVGTAPLPTKGRAKSMADGMRRPAAALPDLRQRAQPAERGDGPRATNAQGR